MKHVMIDLETMGTAFNAPVLAIGAVYFDPNTGALGDKFYGAIDIADAFRHGKASGDTVRWWMKQADEARKAAIAGTRSSAEVFADFAAFMKKSGIDVCPWGNGAAFDISILEYAFPRITGAVAPWDFWNVRDCRTIKDLASGIAYVPKSSRKGTHHQALDDAVFQAEWVSEMWQVLRGAKSPAPKKVLIGDDMDDLLA